MRSVLGLQRKRSRLAFRGLEGLLGEGESIWRINELAKGKDVGSEEIV